MHQQNDIRTYRRRRINLDISQNLRVYNLRSRGQFDYDPKIRSIYLFIYYYYYWLFLSKWCLIYLMLSFLYLKCTKILSTWWQLPLSYHGELVLIISYFFRPLLWGLFRVTLNAFCVQCAILFKQFGLCNLPRLYDIWISPTLRNY